MDTERDFSPNQQAAAPAAIVPEHLGHSQDAPAPESAIASAAQVPPLSSAATDSGNGEADGKGYSAEGPQWAPYPVDAQDDAGAAVSSAPDQGDAEPVEEPRSGRVRAVLRETVETVLLALLIFASVRSVVQNFKVEGSSMEPNLHTGQYLLVNKAAYFYIDPTSLGLAKFLPAAWQKQHVIVYPFGAPTRGDVIVFKYPRDPQRDFIKRVIAVSGDTVEIRQGHVYVNGEILKEPYLIESPAYSKEPEVVPPGQFYVLGDNRNNSSDSHVWGPVPHEDIIGKAWLSYWPLSDWGMAPNYTVSAEKVSAAN